MGSDYKNKYFKFTAIELIAVLLLMGILAVVLLSKSSPDKSALYSETEILKSNLRYVQMLSLSDDSATWGLSISNGSYTIYKNGSAAGISIPGQGSNTKSLSGVSVSSGTGTITFDNWGSPGSSTMTVVLTDGSSSETITITKNTGFIP